MSALDVQLARLERAMNATPAEQAALVTFAASLNRCPVGHPIGDSDAALGRCSACSYPRRLGGRR